MPSPAPTVTGALYQVLAADEDLQELLGGAGHVRVFPAAAPQGTAYPYITLQLIGDPPHHHQGGVSAIRDPLVQVDTWAADTASRDLVAARLRALLDGGRWTLAQGTIRLVTLENQQDSDEPRAGATGSYTFRCRMDARVWYVPT